MGLNWARAAQQKRMAQQGWQQVEKSKPRVKKRRRRIGMTNEEIDAARSKKGGWTRETLAKWGVPWPPPKGWRKALLKGKPIPQPDRPIGRTADFDSANVGSSPAPAARYVRNTELKVTTRVDSGIWHVHDGDDLLGEFPNSEAAWRFVDKREMARW